MFGRDSLSRSYAGNPICLRRLLSNIRSGTNRRRMLTCRAILPQVYRWRGDEVVAASTTLSATTSGLSAVFMISCITALERIRADT